MIDYELFCKIKHLKEHEGLTAPQIAEELALDPRTVAKWLAHGQFCRRKAASRPSKLDPFKKDIRRMLENHAYSAAQILQRIGELGFDGGYTIVKEYVRRVRPPKTRAYLTLSFAPGDCAQVDWGSYGSVNAGNTRRRLSFFVMVLCYSRMMYVEFTVSQTMEHFLACHQNAFNFFGAVPKKLMVDNLKSAVLRRSLGRAPVFNPRYFDFANHCGFTIAPCNVGKGNEKGRVENAVGYVKKNFLAGLDIPDFATIAPAARHWLETVANVRIHGETRKRPVELFEKERPCLSALAENAFDVATVSQSQGFQPVPHHPGHQPLLGARRICRSAPDVKKLPRPALHLLRRQTCRPPCAEATIAIRTSRIRTIPRSCWLSAKKRVTRKSSCAF